MKKTITLFVMLLLLFACLSPVCFANGKPYDENFFGLEVDPMDMYIDVLKAVSSAAFRSEQKPIKDICFGESHSAILFDDGTVTAFQSFGWYGEAYDFNECKTSKWENISKIACGAEVTYGLKNDGSIVYSGEPYYLGFDSGYCDSATLSSVLSKKDYADVATSKYSPLFLLKKDGSVLVELDQWGIYDAAEKWGKIVDIEFKNGLLYALQKNGTIHVLSDYGENSGKVKNAVALKTVGIQVYAVLKNGSMKSVRSIIPGISEDDHRCRELFSNCPACENAQYVWSISDFFPGDSDAFVYKENDGKPTVLYSAAGHGIEYWEDLQDLYFWQMYLPESYVPSDWPDIAGHYSWGSRNVLVLGILEDGTCRLLCYTDIE